VDLVSIDEGGKKVAVKEKGDFLMVGSDRPTPASSVGSTSKLLTLWVGAEMTRGGLLCREGVADSTIFTCC